LSYILTEREDNINESINDHNCTHCGKLFNYGLHECTDEQEKMSEQVWEEERRFAMIEVYRYQYRKFMKTIKKLFGGRDV